ncbi:hypothetical protein Pcinc_020972 [Petrolisthes cinctipes]|uniref:Uncharacterized protein n=1 Tax=Petrolisthes cinctipes TaxID=88211 RepID=A0AAE1FHB8_PETCI|nr:hypothetical protein Pcinc_020972 [Petrolisthes cinctipes]
MPSHKDMKIFFSLEKSELSKVKQLYIRLTDEDLLKRCLQGKTQNSNESLHSRVWKYCPKTKCMSKKIFDFALSYAVLNYNIGYEKAHPGKELALE